MNNKCVVIGVSGGVAVYKALEVISRLRKKDIEVRVIMTESAQKFVTPLSFQSLSQNMVTTDMFDEPKAWEIQHISLAKKADLMLVLPATANIIGKVANGIADDMLSTTIMATKAPVVFAPAMNTNMYGNPIVQNNIEKLKSFGYEFIEPASGRLACGDVGAGKLADVEDIYEFVLKTLYKTSDLEGKKVLITAGPTISPIDPVRFITNRSTGKMGYAIAEEARNRGAEVTLISGPTNIKPPYGVKTIKISTNEEMKNEVLKYFDYDKIKNTVLIRRRKSGDYIQINNQGNNKKLKQFFIDEKIPKDTRDSLPLIADGSHIMWIPGYRMSEAYKVEEGTKLILEISLDGGIYNERQY